MTDRSSRPSRNQADERFSPAVTPRTVVALAGRRPDPVDAETPRFPLAAVPVVRRAIRDLFETENVGVLVSSAACGADLLALDAADKLGLRRIVVLPFAPKTFRASSVVDRPGEWGPLYDRVLDTLPERDIIVLDGKPTEEGSYTAANEAILSTARMLASGREDHRSSDARAIATTASTRAPLAVLVWDGAPRGADDVTASFKRRAEKQGFRIRNVSTLLGKPARRTTGRSERGRR